MKAFSSEQELQTYLRKVAEQAQQRGADKKMLDSALSVANVGAEPPAPAKAEVSDRTWSRMQRARFACRPYFEDTLRARPTHPNCLQ